MRVRHSSSAAANDHHLPSTQTGHSSAGTSHHHHHHQSNGPPATSVALGDGHITLRYALLHKYVLLCLICGGMSLLLGLVFIVIQLMLRNYTSSLHYFETIPTYIPAIVLIINGVIVMCFARRKYRYAILIKLAGALCLVCALLCVAITVTTTVVHMNRLQSLHDCAYSTTTRSCVCTSFTQASQQDLLALLSTTGMPSSPSMAGAGSGHGTVAANNATVTHSSHMVFHDVSSCDLIHGGLFTCLRALFGLSVFGILVCIFASMLVYQLLSHEKKKTYFEQLETRRRFQQHGHGGHRSRHFSGLVAPPLPHGCNCADDISALYPGAGWFPPPPPPGPWDLMDYQSYAQPPPPPPPCDDNPSSSARSWLNWPWPSTAAGGHQSLLGPNQRSDSNNNSSGGGFFARLFRRNNGMAAGQTRSSAANGGNGPLPHARPGGLPPLPPPHAFHMSRLGPATFQLSHGRRSSGAIRNRTLPTLSLAARSALVGDAGYFHHHLHHHHGFPPSVIGPMPPPHLLWGPPPPYQPSAEGNSWPGGQHSQSTGPTAIAADSSASQTQTEGPQSNSHHHHRRHHREASIHSGTADRSSKVSTPLSERRMLCNAFSTDRITLTIGNQNGAGPTTVSTVPAKCFTIV